MPYNFYIDGIRLPVTPGSLDISIKNQNKTAVLINGGEINILKSPGLTEISFKALIPQVWYSFSNQTKGSVSLKATVFLLRLNALKESRKPFQFIVSRTAPDGRLLFDTNIKVSLEDYKITESASDGLDVTVDFKLKQYRDYGTKTITLPPVPLPDPAPTGPALSVFVMSLNESKPAT